MTESIFFELPVYRCSRTKHTAEMDALREKWTINEYKEKLPQSYHSNIAFILNRLGHLAKKEYSNRYLDATTFKIMGKFIDWK